MPVIIIPARLGSTRLPKKLLLDETGYPLLWHTAQRALESKLINDVIIATEDREIMEIIEKFGHPRIYPVMTPKCESGTERIAWVVQQIKDFDFSFVVNFQGDEPELPGKYIDLLVDCLARNPTADVATLAGPISYTDYWSQDTVKVVLTHDDRAMYFSRAPIPFGTDEAALAHIGIYAYRHDFLLAVPTLKEGTLPTERLEQLQWLQSGFKIQVLKTDIQTVGVDTKEEYNLFVRRERMRMMGCPPPPPPSSGLQN